MSTYILDTNILLQNPEALYLFPNSNIIIPFTVIEELDNRKKKLDEVGKNSRHIIRILDNLRKFGKLSDGVSLQNNSNVKIELNNLHSNEISLINLDKYDNKILTVVYNLNKKYDDLIFLTNDLNLRIKADVLGIKSEEFYCDKIENDNLVYNETRILELNSSDIDKFYKNGKLELDFKIDNVYPNEFFVIKSLDNSSHSGLCRYFNKYIYKLRYENESIFDVVAKNKEQKFAFELLMNPKIKIVSLIGLPGSGKTLISLAAAFEQVLEKNIYNKVLVTRPMASIGQDVGFLKGTKDEKFLPWMAPIFDNCEVLFSNNGKKQTKQIIDDMIFYGQLDLEPLTYIRGRTLPFQYIVCDESQNMSKNLIKTLLTRIGENSKIILTGDPSQIDNPYLNQYDNGLVYATEKLKNENISGCVNLIKGERSDVVEICSRLL